MRTLIGTRVVALALAAGWWLAAATAAEAASPLAGIPVGNSANYHLTAESDKPPAQGGSTSTSTYIRFMRSSETTIGVTVNGAPAGQITVNGDGSLITPPALSKVLAPFGEISLLLKGAPQPLAPNSSWAANVPIPLGDETDNVAAVVSVSQYGPSGASIVASGQNATTVQPMIRKKPADITYNAAMTFNTGRMLTSARRNVAVAVKAGAFRTKNITSNWTLSLVGP